MAAPELAFSPQDGALSLAGTGLRVAKGKSKVELGSFLRSSLNHGNGYEWLSFHNVTFGGLPCGFSLCFSKGELEAISLGVDMPDVKLEAGWPTTESIEAEVAFIRATLSTQLGVEIGEQGARFAWGSAWSTFDRKGVQASAGVRYET